ncbi:uncharacterized protein LOC107815772 [Nicotiana tabacum]|uniref:Uncharacterized protein LOC107815772 n=1 Tax=Nicotiana tabacum TaxID=4097 RepID=A0A1S4C6N0_TOBAC|nr:PREDICTED: uncharacterized protein LOC107815772 [Nicotiana tabacum]
MGTEILRPQDILIERFRVPPSAFHRRRSNFGNENGYFNPRNRKSVVRTEKKKLNNQPEPPSITRRCASAVELRQAYNDGLEMGRVTILRRGESLNSLVQPEMLPKHIRVGLSSADVYAGSAFSNSPSPRALPLPSFFNKKQEDFKSFDDSATRDLRRLLRLEY